MDKCRKSIGILGAGAFGTALAIVYARTFNVTLFSYFEDHLNSMKENKANDFIEKVQIPCDIHLDITKNLTANQFDYLFWAFPIKPTIEIFEELKINMNGTNVIICSKGLLPDASFLYDMFEKEITQSKIGYLSGPNFAIELAEGKVAAADIASKNFNVAVFFAADLTTPTFKLCPFNDVIGIQICGAIKNIIAIGSGIIDGLNLGQNAHAAFLTFALFEMKDLGVKLGANETTFYRLCGLGDLILTATGLTSRNASLGSKIANGELLDDILKKNKSTCEGCDTIAQVIKLARKNAIKLPICEEIYKILFENQAPLSILNAFK
ncbi:MAG: NAD(P)H-dependent glycerol-3-phosphate dehydrogenase [Holosporales bacterium]|nr:NAD(P)H-dependent glycerol-3-phosphate dehydrogenase [Holosporales bacterium]